MDLIAYKASKTYTDKTAEEFGGLKGANCTIKSITPISGGNRITFEWENTSGVTQEGTLDVMDGVDGDDGRGIKSVDINASNHLIITYDDDSTKDAGEVETVQGEDGKSAYEVAVEQGYVGTEEEWLASLKGEQGEEGFSPEITVKESTSDRYVLTIKTKDDEFDTPNLKGGGSGSASAMSDLEDVQLTSLTTGQILKWNGSKWVNEDGVEIDSLGDINDVALGTLTDGQVLSWNATLGKWENKDAVNPTQFDTMPTAADFPQAIVQYTGADTVNYKRGMFYRSNPSVVSGSVVYTWEQINVQPSNTDYEQLTNLPQIGGVEVVGNKELSDFNIQSIIQVESFVPATSANAGKIVQFIGTTTSDYKKGFFYQSAYDTETAGYVWKNVDVSSNAQLASRITNLETNQGDMSQLEIAGVSDIVAALNALNGKGLSTITYTEPNLILTYEDGNVITFNVRDSILDETQIGELANVTDTAIQDTNILQYDAAILGYKPYDIVLALTNLLTESKDYTDQEIASSLTASAFVCDAKPSYDAVNDVVIYFQNGEAHTTDKTDSRFYYTNLDGSFCSSWIQGIEFTFNVAQVDYDEFVNKNTDVVSTYTEDMLDKSKIPDIAALDALLAIVKTALALKVNTSSIVDALTSQDATKVLSANQGYVINDMISAKNDKMQYATLPTASSALSGVVYQYVGATSQAYTKGKFYVCVYDSENDVWYWNEIKYAADTDSALDPTSKNPVANDALCAEFDDKQDKDLETPLAIEGTTETTVEGALSGLNSRKAKAFMVLTMASPSADLENVVVQYVGATTSTYNEGSFYKCKEILPSTDPKTYEWVELTQKIEFDNALDIDSTNGIENQAVTNALQALQNGVVIMYASESALPSLVNYAGGVIVAVGSVAFCVAEKTWHKVTAINPSSLAITWSAFNPNIALEETSTLPTASVDLLNKCYLYIGATTSTLDKGKIYQCQAVEVVPEGTEDPSALGWYELVGTTYELSADTSVDSSKTYYEIKWVSISSANLVAGKGITIEGNTINADTNIFPGTLDEWNALTEAEQAKYDFIASLDEADKEPVIPRYVSLLSRGITTTGSVSLDGGKKFSDYQAIKFEVASRGGSSSYEYVYRGSIELPIEDIQMGSSRTVIIQYNVAGNNYYMAIQITSDTTINVTHVSDSLSSQDTRILRIYGEL